MLSCLLLPINEVCEGSVFTGVCLSTGCAWGRRAYVEGACIAGSMLGVCVWWGHVCGGGMRCMAGGVHGRGSMHGGGHAWQGGMHGGGGMCGGGGGMLGGGCAWQRGMCGRGGGLHGRRDGHCSGQYASYWNAFLFLLYIYIKSSQV